MKQLLILTIAAAAFAAACADPAANKPKAQTSEPVAIETVKPEAASGDIMTDFKAAGTALDITADSSTVEFTGSKVTGSHAGGFKSFRGVIDLVGEKAESSKVLVEIDMLSVYTDADGLTKHLQTGDFFEVEKYPKATFASTKIVPDTAAGAGHYTVTGELEMRGVKKTVTFPATIAINPETVTVNAEFSINRKDFGIVYAGKADDLIRDDVVIRLDLTAPRKK
ncbi:MAG: YceI family protein [Pyrinomonadaceae bacterium]